MKYIKRTSKKNRQELLNQALREELEFLRKRCFPWKRREFLLAPVEIRENKFNNKNDLTTAGKYQKIKTGKYKYKHFIEIRKNILINCQKVPLAYYRKNSYKELRSVIRHELCHAFIEERYENIFSNLENKNYDASPIFLTVLNWVFGNSGHDCCKKFIHTDYSFESNCIIDSFEELDNYIFKMLKDFNEVTEKLKELGNKEEFVQGKTNNLFVITNKFHFSSRKCGFNKFIEHDWVDIFKNKDDKYSKVHNINRTWEIGCNVTPDKLLHLYNRKQNCKAQYYSNKKQLVTITNKNMNTEKITIDDMKTIILKEEKNF
ncbi:hypothetical protein CF081_06520 [Clostridium botulinum]|uniref:SprT-like domain-containing protein n=1 Tax=Clostridium botulinum (strain Kyoto / Type A2) TaxID=536232 RepID=C1FP86_CLOBJ|nr:hypothetical protein [Clostridium botulinum]ACO84547.1 conserved hypothetical protein [Clostridium botulinum A2 str. Kyoto]AUN07027.1 hypothetical protein RSJ14_10035 [Clostridium botulinum]MBN3364720.1 hypothetical protein [Clostridium botulinum]MBN3373731.1 hypothetical protein [Clostridium botulinum]MBN3385476.1 hypothetical protein [Clostridium botulinum]